ncbi:MAG TPA: hypothetical protein P5330_00955 [Candidatus Competibacteraceae bacterium]|nr:hypothetical protein [Candidatus Competibacteraceae bacterium]
MWNPVSWVAPDAQVLTFPQLSASTLQTLDEFINDRLTSHPDDARIAFLFVDCLSRNIGALTTAAFNNLGFEIAYLGGGCGIVDFLQALYLYPQ